MSLAQTINYFDNTKNEEILKTVTCQVPFTSYHIFGKGEVANCCFYWMPTFIGNITEKSLKEIIVDDRSMAVKKSVCDGTYKFCNGEICPSMVQLTSNNKITAPLMPFNEFDNINEKQIILFLDYDTSCNLYCGSCRNERILYSLDNAPASLKDVHERVMTQVQELLNDGYEITLQVTSAGDPFASPFYWQFLQSIKGTEKFKVRLTTNGTLMTHSRLQWPFAQQIDHIEVSVDAFTASTYQKVRRGGNFQALHSNLKNLDEMIVKGQLSRLDGWKLNFVVQKANYHEMVDFAKWALQFKKLNFVWFLLIYDWGHLREDEFKEKAVWHKDHSEHDRFIEVLKDPVFDDPRIILGNLASLRKQALSAAL